MSDPIRSLAARIAATEALSVNGRNSQLAYTALEDGAIREFDLDGTQTAQYGKQYDGTSVAATFVSPPPPAPFRPAVTGVAGGLAINWDGTFVDDAGTQDVTIVAPMDWTRTDVVVGPVGFDPIATAPNAAIASPRGGDVFLAMVPGAYEVALVTRTASGRPSAPSAKVAGTALLLVDTAQFDTMQAELDAAEADIDQAQIDITNAFSRIGDAEADIVAVNDLANLAKTTADAAATIYRQSSAPSMGMAAGDMWIDSDDGKIYIYVGSTWTLSDDQRIGQVVTSNATKITMFAQPSMPATTGRTTGDMWFDTDDGNRLYDWNGSAWTSRSFGLAAITATARELGGVAVYRQTSPPAGTLVNGDLWIDSDDSNKTYYYNGTWVLSDDSRIATVVTSDATKTTLFAQNSAPSTAGRVVGDTWIDLDDNELVYRWSGSAWVKTDIASFAYIQSRATDMVTNGTGYLADNYNFATYFDYNGVDVPTGATGSFYAKTTAQGSFFADGFIPFDPAKKIRLGFQIRQTVGGAVNNAYGFLAAYDAYGLGIQPGHYMYIAGTITTLAVALNPGATTVTLIDSSNWYGSAGKPAGAANYFRGFQFWNYTDAGGKVWPAGSYTRNLYQTDFYADGGVVGNVITLRVPWAGAAFPAGTPVSQPSSGGNYHYMPSFTNLVVSEAWIAKSDTFSAGIFPSASQAVASTGAATWATGMPPGTGKVRVGWLLNYPSGGGRMAVASVSLSDASAAADLAAGANALATTAATTANSKITVYRQSTAPTGGTYKVNGDLWIDSTTGMVYYPSTVSGSWLPTPDQRIGLVVTSDAAKVTVFVQTSQPATTGRTVGDIWIDSDDSNKIYDWPTGGPWTGRLLGDAALADMDVAKLTATAATINTLVAQKIAASTATFQTVDIGNLFVSGTTVMADVVAQRLAAETGEFLTITANNLTAVLALITKICSAETGRRWEADQLGIRLFDVDGSILVNLPTDPNTPASITGDLVASSLTVTDQLAIRGVVNELSKGARLTLAGGTTAPSSPPTVSLDWPSIDTDYANGDENFASFNAYRYGWVRHPTLGWITLQEVYNQNVLIDVYNDAGDRTGTQITTGLWNARGGLTVIGSTIYVMGQDSSNIWRVMGYSAAGAQLSNWVYTLASGSRQPKIANDGTNLVIAYSTSTANVLVWQYRAPASGTAVGSTVVSNTTLAVGMDSFWYGSADFGADRAIFHVPSSTGFYVTTAAGVYDSTNNFTSPSTSLYGFDYYGGVFRSHDTVGHKLYQHTGIKWTTESPNWFASTTWYDPDTGGNPGLLGLGTHETTQGPRKNFTMIKRARITVTPPPLPIRPIPNTNDDPTASRVYLGRGAADPGRTFMERNATGSAGQTSFVLTAATLPVSTATNFPPVSSDFPASSPAQIISSDGSSIVLVGDGSFTLAGIVYNKTTNTLTVAADDVAVAGSSLPRGAKAGTSGYAQITATTTVNATAQADVPGLSVTVTVAAGRRVKITFQCQLICSVAGDQGQVRIAQDGVAVQSFNSTALTATALTYSLSGCVVITPTAGTHIYKLTVGRSSGTGNINMYGSSTVPDMILVEDIGPA